MNKWKQKLFVLSVSEDETDMEAGGRPLLQPKLKYFIIRQGEGRPWGFSVSSYRGVLAEDQLSCEHSQRRMFLCSIRTHPPSSSLLPLSVSDKSNEEMWLWKITTTSFTHITCCTDTTGLFHCDRQPSTDTLSTTWCCYFSPKVQVNWRSQCPSVSMCGDAECSWCARAETLGEAVPFGLCAMNTMLDTKGAQKKEKCQSPPDSEPIIEWERRRRCVWEEAERERRREEEGGRREGGIQRCTKHMHPFTVVISSRSQQPELVANQTELFCSESTSSQLTNDCFLWAQTNSDAARSGFISYPFCHSFHWLAPVLSTRTSLLSIPPALYFPFLFFLLSKASSSSPLFVCVCVCVLIAEQWWNLGVPVATGVCACAWACKCVCACSFQGRGSASSSLIHTNVHW